MKYIITNCPAIEAYCTCGKCYDWDKQISTRCKDITDCVLKRIVDELREACIDCSSIKRVTYTQCKYLNNCKTAKILQLLEIEEVE